jgi:hypothetical protein
MNKNLRTGRVITPAGRFGQDEKWQNLAILLVEFILHPFVKCVTSHPDLQK